MSHSKSRASEIDAEALNRFHGAHFGDELETEDEEVAEEAVEESAEEVVEEASEEASEDEASEDADEAEAPAIKFQRHHAQSHGGIRNRRP